MTDYRTAIAISLTLTALVLLAWAVWGVRQYRRTGNEQWLWMAALMGLSLIALIGNWLR